MHESFFATAFAALRHWLSAQLEADEHFTLWYAAEDSDFIRFNHARVRQASHVRQIDATLRLIRNERHASQQVSLCGEHDEDCRRLGHALAGLRTLLADLPADPYLLVSDEAWRSEREIHGRLPTADELIEQVATLGAGTDLVGIYAGGPLYRGFASSWGAHGWHTAHSASLDWSLFAASGEAVKSIYAASEWNATALREEFQRAREQLVHLDKPGKTLAPGTYRVYLAPTALEEVIGLLEWGGFSARALATRQSPLQQLQLQRARLSPQVWLTEQASQGLEPAFNADGFQRQDQALVRAGELVGQLVSARSSREYGLPGNGASHWEAPVSLVMQAGDLPSAEVLAALDTGIYIGNLWYLNWSDIDSARMTGMTRFASFWVENGKIVAPIAAMRFDDSLYGFLGERLLALTRERTLCVSTRTYGYRHLDTRVLPGALIERLTFTL